MKNNQPAYREILTEFLINHYSVTELRALCKHFDLSFEAKGTEPVRRKEDRLRIKASMVQALLDKVFDENRLYALFCVIKQFTKYHKGDYEKIIRDGRELAPVPYEIQRPRLQNGCEIPLEPMDTVQPGPYDIRFREHCRAIVIGVSRNLYGEENGSMCGADANAMADFLREEWGVPYDRIRVLQGYVQGKDARKALQEICDQATEEDCLLFYFSGYSMEVNGIGYLMTSDSYIHMNTVRNGLRLITVNEILLKCKARIKLRLFDANYSGQRLEELVPEKKEMLEPVNEVVPYDILPENISRNILEAGCGWITFSSCDLSQKSYELAEYGHGVFTHFLLKGLRDKQARRHNKLIYLEDLKIYTTRMVMETMNRYGICQTPQYQCEMNGRILME